MNMQEAEEQLDKFFDWTRSELTSAGHKMNLIMYSEEYCDFEDNAVNGLVDLYMEEDDVDKEEVVEYIDFFVLDSFHEYVEQLES